ncbi:Glycosyl transferase family 2 [Pedobacter westerhofensis]|uniref:Glycosyl transferase family 2 n=1 Tax=Pedobacter westerhofensis TaxID=425512 RepID=A0A521FR97_9SPHI|nr:glycosyltransferase family A protein [Pedobacter westerhofensis]SMO98737.1 Glycosyl transferase family 2 [Pedobacter westerhofensis]
MKSPFVSCIMPTANREKYIPFAIRYFLEQNYSHSELIIVDDGKTAVSSLIPDHESIRYFYTEPLGTIGLKRNYAINLAKGDIILHWDDDDWHAMDWISRSVNFLIDNDADITGIKHVHYFSPIMNTFWQGDANNRNNPNSRVWLNGATLAYWKSYWKKHPFKDLQKGEDDDFIQHDGARVYAHDYINGFIAILHQHNTTVKPFENLKHKKNI